MRPRVLNTSLHVGMNALKVNISQYVETIMT